MWLNYGRTLVGTPTIVLTGAVLAMTSAHVIGKARRRSALIDLTLLIYVLAYLIAQWLVAFNLCALPAAAARQRGCWQHRRRCCGCGHGCTSA
ncbi:MAG: hypothetical protein U0521_25210 [Anaerolineae bacterium]